MRRVINYIKMKVQPRGQQEIQIVRFCDSTEQNISLVNRAFHDGVKHFGRGVMEKNGHVTLTALCTMAAKLGKLVSWETIRQSAYDSGWEIGPFLLNLANALSSSAARPSRNSLLRTPSGFHPYEEVEEVA